jgi:hypothetical protein
MSNSQKSVNRILHFKFDTIHFLTAQFAKFSMENIPRYFSIRFLWHGWNPHARPGCVVKHALVSYKIASILLYLASPLFQMDTVEPDTPQSVKVSFRNRSTVGFMEVMCEKADWAEAMPLLRSQNCLQRYCAGTYPPKVEAQIFEVLCCS